jgi:hypothetical protein
MIDDDRQEVRGGQTIGFSFSFIIIAINAQPRLPVLCIIILCVEMKRSV